MHTRLMFCTDVLGVRFCRFCTDARRAVLYIYEIQVSAEAQGMGIGKALLFEVQFWLSGWWLRAFNHFNVYYEDPYWH